MTDHAAGAPQNLWIRLIELFGLDPRQRDEIYAAVAGSANLRDGSYWVEIVFSAGIATLGLILNSPAVIIGAMLISPLMGPILASGLAFAAGDLVLGMRATGTVVVSAFTAVAFSTLLVIFLPFREMTPEIAARTQPNTLDLLIALFSGAVGSIAVCKSVRGVATSIPGVAIAVALMPPLCVIGYGIGVALTIDPLQGRSVIRGGGLLFITNLVAITFTAMLVFLLFRIEGHAVRESPLPLPKSLRTVGSLPGRIVLIGSFILLLFFPLSRSLDALKREIANRHLENAVQQQVTHIWQSTFARFPNGAERSYVDSLSVSQAGERLRLHLRIFTSSPYSAEERAMFLSQLAVMLKRPAKMIDLTLVEIPTSRFELATHAKPEPQQAAPPSLSEMIVTVEERVDSALQTLLLPPPAMVADHALLYRSGSTAMIVRYVSDHALASDAQALLENEVRRAIGIPGLTVTLEYIPSTYTITFSRGATLSAEGKRMLQSAGEFLAGHPAWQAGVAVRAGDRSKAARIEAVTAALGGAGVDRTRIVASESESAPEATAVVTLSPLAQ